MTSELEHKTRLARKEYTCDYCGGKIDKGERYDYYKGVNDGEIFVWRSHLSCQSVADSIWDYCDLDEGMSEDDFQAGCGEVCPAFICPDCSKWDKEYEHCSEDKVFCIDKMQEFFRTHELYEEKRKGYYRLWKCRERVTD